MKKLIKQLVNYFEKGHYVGEWKDGKKHGQGTYTCKDGTIGKGIWKDNELIEL